MKMRLQKFMAHAGVCSRRHAERMISEGRVMVNGVVVSEAGVKVEPGSDIVVADGRKVVLEDSACHEYWLFYKPVSVLSTVRDPFGRPTVMDFFHDIPAKRLYPVGRLDFDSEGLLLLTNDGELANRMLHPRYKFDKTYHVTVKGHPSEKDILKLENGLLLDGKKTLPCSITPLGKTRRSATLRVILREGRKRQIRRMFDAVNHRVTRLLRVSSGPLTIKGMKPGARRALDAREIAALKKMCGQAAEAVTSGTLEGN